MSSETIVYTDVSWALKRDVHFSSSEIPGPIRLNRWDVD